MGYFRTLAEGLGGTFKAFEQTDILASSPRSTGRAST
jgi:hypothetical protein